MEAGREQLARRYRRMRGRLGTMIFEGGDFIETATQVSLKDLDIEDPDRVGYEASGWSFLARALRRREVRPGIDVFADFGCGKGRVVYQAAASRPFKRVIGIEMAPSLTEVARLNIERNRDRLKCRDVEIVTTDATTYEIPDDLTIAYFFNPFTGEAFQKVIDNLVESLERAPRELRIVYANPVRRDYLEATDKFDLVRESKGLRRRNIEPKWVFVYAAKPELTRGAAQSGEGATA